MYMKFWLPQLRQRFRQSSKMRGRRNAKHASPAAIQILEDRALLATFTVSNLNDSGAGSLRQAITDANNEVGADEISFTGDGAEGTITLASQLRVSDSLTVNGPGAETLIISGAGSSRVMQIGGSGVQTFVLDGLGITGGSVGFGGGLLAADNFDGNDTLTIRNSEIFSNAARNGGGIHAVGMTLNIVDSTIRDNTASTSNIRGGGGLSLQSATTTLTRVELHNNTSEKDGGGIYNLAFTGSVGNRDSTLTIIDSTIHDNSALNGRGGGILNENQNVDQAARLILQGSSVSNNDADIGGGILSDAGIVTISNSLIAENTTAAGGAGFFLVNSTTRIESSTVSGNTAGGNGGGMENLSDGPTAAVTLVNATFANNVAPQGEAVNNFADTGGTVAITYANTIFADNTGSALGNIVSFGPGTSSATSLGNNIFDDSTGNLTAAGDQPNTNPMLLALADNGGLTRTHELMTGSPAIDSGDSGLSVDAGGNVLTTDQRGNGFSRISDGDIDGTATVDIGAFEVPKVSQLIIVEADDATSVSESVGIDSFTVELNFQPATDVVVQLTGVDVTEFVLDQATLTFTPGNWNVPQAIEVMGIDDRGQDGDITTTLTIAVDAANSDPEFAATIAHELTVTTTDNEATSTIGLGQSFDNHAPTQVLNYTIALVGLFPSSDGSLDEFDPVLGQIGIVGFNFAPGGSAFADGQILQISDNTALFSILGTTYGGDGETTFALPDLRGRVPVGADPANGIPVGTEIGSTTVTLTEANLPSQTHALTGSSATLESTGHNQPFDNQQPALALTPVIARQGVFEGLGEVVWFAGNFVPDQELPADGSLLAISSNTALFSVLGTSYGGDGETTFGLPDLRGRAVIGSGSGPGLTTRNQGQEIGDVSTVVTTANLSAHTHQLEAENVETTGSGAPLSNLHPAISMRYLVSLFGTFPSEGGGGSPGRALGGAAVIGQIAVTASSLVPDGFALANGQLLNIVSHTALFSLYGVTYGGDGETTFGLPDLRGRLAAHDGPAGGLGTKHGAETVALTEATMPAHSHEVIPPDEYVVTTTVDEIDFTNTDVSLREAVISANYDPGQQDITFAAALSGTTIVLSAGQLELTSNVTITGPGMAADLIIDAQQNSRVFRIDAGVTATLTQLTVTNGNADNNVEQDFAGSLGGGILNAGGTLTLDDVQVTNSAARYGAGINNYGHDGIATINVLNSTIRDNIADDQAGGLYNWGNNGAAVANIIGSTFKGNSAAEIGGAILNWPVSAELNVINSSFGFNFAGDEGGALYNTEAIANFVNSTIVGNVAEHGGAVVNIGGSVKLDNSIVAGNSLVDGGFGDVEGPLDATSANNLVGNAATVGGLINGTNNNIVGVDWTTVVANDGTSPTFDDNGGTTQTIALLQNSPAVDAGSNATAADAQNVALTTDQRGTGFSRINDGDASGTSTVDIGAFEFTSVTLNVVIVEATIGENAGLGSGTVTRTGDVSSELTVTLTSDDNGEATVPVSVTIAAGQSTSLDFTITSVDDTVVDGTQTVTVTASAPRFVTGVDSLEVTDDDTPGLLLAIAASSVDESDGASATTATITRNTAATEELVVSLVSSDTSEAAVPTSITIAAGETTSAPFAIAAVDDSDVDGTQTVTVTASAIGFANGAGTVDVTDDDSAAGDQGNVDGDEDFDANDAFLIQLVQLAGSDAQIDQSKGPSPLTAAEIRANISALGVDGDVDGDVDFDANDSFLIQLVKLAGSDTQIDQTKGASPLSATEIRSRVDRLGGGNSGQQARASLLPRLAAVGFEQNPEPISVFDVVALEPTPISSEVFVADWSGPDEVWSEYRSWIDAL